MSWDGTERRKQNISSDQHEISQTLARIDERLKNFVDIFERHTISVKEKFDKHDVEIHELQNNYWKAVGAFAALMFIIQIGLTMLPKHDTNIERRLYEIERKQKQGE